MSKYKELSDIEIMKRVAKYDSRALEELYSRYSSILYTLIKKISPDEKTTEDILVEVFAIIWRKIDHFDFNTSNVYTWLVTLARNKAIDNLRRSRGYRLVEYTDEYENYFIIPDLDKKVDPLDVQTAYNLKPRVESGLAKLTDAQKYVIHLAFYEGFTLDEIADRLGIPVETVRDKVLRSLHNLRDNVLSEEA